MSDDGGVAKIEINAPPKSIEIQSSPVVEDLTATPNPQNQGITLTGGIGQTQSNLMATQPQNVKFVMGPNGQMIAIEKPPFVWKHFFIGGGIPFAIFFVPLLILMIGTGLGYDDNDEWTYVSLYKDENSTAYTGQFTLGEDSFVDYCSIRDTQNYEYLDVYCDKYDDYKVNILMYNGTGDEIVGHWNNENGTVYFDTGTDYGEELELMMEFYTEDGSYDFFMLIGDFAGLTCFLGLILSIVFLVIGFSQGKPGMGWGGVTALVSFPVVSFISLIIMW